MRPAAPKLKCLLEDELAAKFKYAWIVRTISLAILTSTNRSPNVAELGVVKGVVGFCAELEVSSLGYGK